MKASAVADEPLCNPVELIALARAGNLEALDRMTRCYGDRLLAVGRRHCRSEADAKDAVQDALLSAGEHLRDFRGDGSLEGWLVRMVANACRRMRRGRKNDPALHDTGAAIASTEHSPEETAHALELSHAIGQVLLSFEPTDRLIVLLAEGEGYDSREIAERLHLSPGAVRTRLSRARARIRYQLSEWLADPRSSKEKL